MAKMSRDKGKRGEREVAALLKEHGFEARRGQQFHGGPGSPDVVHNMGPYHVEVKRVETFNAYGALAQAEQERGSFEKSIVLHKRNGRCWIAVMKADDLLGLIKELEDYRATEALSK